MKTRSGFVSNSSSSSFVILGRELTRSDVVEGKIDNVWVIGEYLYEGLDVFSLTNPMLNELKTNKNRFSGTLVEAYVAADTEWNHKKVKKSDIKAEEFNVFAVEADYHVTGDLETFIEKYLNEESY